MNVYMKFNKKEYATLRDFTEDFGLDYLSTKEKLEAGWTKTQIINKDMGLLGAKIINNPDKYEKGSIFLEGREFKNLDEVIDFYGVPKETFYERLFSGWTIYACLGLDEMLFSFYNTPYGLVHDDKLYTSQAELSRIRNCTVHAIKQNIQRNWSRTELLGLKKRANNGFNTRKKVVVFGKEYNSLTEFRNEYGIKPHHITLKDKEGMSLEDIAIKYGSKNQP